MSDFSDVSIGATAESVRRHLSAVFKDPETVAMIVDGFNNRHPQNPISDKEQQYLKWDAKFSDAPLAEAVFNSGIKDLIASGKATIGQLEGEEKLVGFLRRNDAQTMIKEDIVSVEQLKHKTPEQLAHATEALSHDNPAQAAKILGLDDKQAAAFKKAVEDTRAQTEPRAPLPGAPARAKSQEPGQIR